MPDFIQQQRAFTAYIRDPEENPLLTDVPQQRMAVYRELFYNNVQGLLSSTYPVLHKILPSSQWHSLIQDYFSKHQAHTPLFPQMPKEFLRYLEDERIPQAEDPAFLWELAHYEWAELGVSIDTREVAWNAAPPEDVLTHSPRLSPLAWVFAYRFPVHKISLDYQPTEAPETPTYLVIYRTPDDEVNFMLLNPVSAHLLNLIDEGQGQLNGQNLLQKICDELQHPKPEVVIQSGIGLLHDFYQKSILL